MDEFEFRDGIALWRQGHSFYALLVAAFKKADSNNLEKLKVAFPDEFEIARKRYAAPDSGLLPGEKWPSEAAE